MENIPADTRLMKKLYKFFFKFSSKRMAILCAEYVLDAIKRTPEEMWNPEIKEQPNLTAVEAMKGK